MIAELTAKTDFDRYGKSRRINIEIRNLNFYLRVPPFIKFPKIAHVISSSRNLLEFSEV